MSNYVKEIKLTASHGVKVMVWVKNAIVSKLTSADEPVFTFYFNGYFDSLETKFKKAHKKANDVIALLEKYEVRGITDYILEYHNVTMEDINTYTEKYSKPELRR